MSMKKIEVISKENFNNLSLSQQQITIAKDVLMRIEIKQVTPFSGSFCKLVEDGDTDSIQLSEKLKSSETYCYACAKGSLFLSYIGIVNDYKVTNTGNIAWHGERMKSKEMVLLSNIFSPHQLSLIETVFEDTVYPCNEVLSGEDILRCKKFAQTYPNNTKRLIAICENIIDNNGIFIP